MNTLDLDPAHPLSSHILEALDTQAGIVAKLDDATANSRPDMPGSNSPIVLLRHTCGSARYWLDHVCLGNENVRDRSGEFSAAGPIAAELETFHVQRAVIFSALEKLRDADWNAVPAAPPSDKQRWWQPTIGGVLVHVYREAAQHLGHMEITRDILLAGMPRAGERSSVLDVIIAELDHTGHAADAIWPDEEYGGHVVTTVDDIQFLTTDIEVACTRIPQNLLAKEYNVACRAIVREQLAALLEN